MIIYTSSYLSHTTLNSRLNFGRPLFEDNAVEDSTLPSSYLTRRKAIRSCREKQSPSRRISLSPRLIPRIDLPTTQTLFRIIVEFLERRMAPGRGGNLIWCGRGRECDLLKGRYGRTIYSLSPGWYGKYFEESREGEFPADGRPRLTTSIIELGCPPSGANVKITTAERLASL